MIYRFDNFALDTAKFELRRDGDLMAAEPQVLSLLLFLVENRDRMVEKDEVVEKIWGGRIVSDSAISSRIKSARQLLGDDGKAQRYIRTVHGRGFRFSGEVQVEGVNKVKAVDESVADAGSSLIPPPSRPSIAVLPFGLLGEGGAWAGMADALPHELIAELARLRWLFVIARGTSFRFREQPADAVAVGRALGVRYCLSGTLEIVGERLAVTVELSDTADGSAIWGERYSGTLDAVHEFRQRILASVIAALEIRIEAHEAERARLMPTESLDAWAAYHLGLERMYRYNRADNLRAQEYFSRAVSLDPRFARALAGLSFTRFQEGFMKYGPDISTPRAAARSLAEAAIEIDRLDPFVNLVMGRALWLEGDLDGSLAWLGRSTELAPNYAQGVYVSGLTQTLTGRATEAVGNVDLALELSPLDPLRYGMLSTRGMANSLLGNHEEAIRFAEIAVHTPGAHKHIALVAAVANELAGRRERAQHWVVQAKRMDPEVTAGDFLASFPFSDPGSRALFAESLRVLGL